MSEKLARVDWQMGQTLLPEHFTALEDALLEDAAHRFGMLALPHYGVGKLRLNDSLLAEGIVSLTALTVVLPSGQVLETGSNSIAGTFNLNVPGTTKVAVYLHLTHERGASEDRRKGAQDAGVDRVIHKLELSAEQTHKSASQTFKLAEFGKSIEGLWSVSEDFVPPLIQMGTSPFLGPLVERIQKTLEIFHHKLQEEIAASYLGGEGLVMAKSALRAYYTLERFIANLKAGFRYHPYHLYEALKGFYIDLCLYKNVTPESAASVYRHDDIAGSMRLIAKPIIDQIQETKQKTPYLPFERANGLFILENLPREARQAKEVYFLIQKPKVSEVISLEGLKLASRARLPVVHQLALGGIPLDKLDRPPFQHGFGSEVEFFLCRHGEEWDYALREGNLACYESDDLAEVKAFLFWRNA
jgi:type VI secretion system protein ImpJ